VTTIIKEKIQSFRIKDISNDEVIKNIKPSSEAINIKTDLDKTKQNTNFAKSSEQKLYNFKDKVTDIKEVMTSEQKKKEEKNERKQKLEKETEEEKNEKRKLGKTKNNRYSLSSRVLRSTEYALDQLLIDDEDDLGIDTIIKTKRGIKKTSALTKKNIEVSKRLSKKVYKVVTSEKAKEFYGKTAIATKKMYERTKEISTKVYFNQKAKTTNKTNSLKQRQKREIIKKAREKVKEKVENAVYIMASKIKDVLTTLFTKKVVLVGLLIITLVITLISAIVGITSLFAYSVNLALDDNITMITEYISELDYNINSQIDNASEKYPYVDKFVYNVPKRAETNQEQVYAYLKAKYGDEKLSETVIKAEIKQIHDNLYDLSFDEKTRTWTETKEDGTTVRHSRTTMTITLTSKTFLEFYEANKDSLLEEHQQQDYENILKLMEENVGKILDNPFPKTDWRKYVTSEYGYRVHPITGEKSKHTGIDIALENGTKIHSCMSGTVNTYNDGNEGFGVYLTVTNGMYKTLYAHCSEILVSDGQKVNAGELIAKVGNTGNSTGPHLHLEYFVNNIRKNPRVYLKVYEE